jgi:hypothetical protein
MGYGGSQEGAGQIVGKSGDGGIDGVIDQDALGLDRIYVQAKRYKVDNSVSEPEIRAFSGSLGAAKANKGVFVTTSSSTQPSINFAERHPSKIVLIWTRYGIVIRYRRLHIREFNVAADSERTLRFQSLTNNPAGPRLPINPNRTLALTQVRFAVRIRSRMRYSAVALQLF